MFDVPVPTEWFPLARIKLPKKKLVECFECNGEGEYKHEECSDCDGHKCANCDGTGKTEVKMVPVAVGNTHYQADYLRLLEDLPNCKVGPHTDPMKQAAFTFDGGDGLLMPMKPWGKWEQV